MTYKLLLIFFGSSILFVEEQKLPKFLCRDRSVHDKATCRSDRAYLPAWKFCTEYVRNTRSSVFHKNPWRTFFFNCVRSVTIMSHWEIRWEIYHYIFRTTENRLPKMPFCVYIVHTNSDKGEPPLKTERINLRYSEPLIICGQPRSCNIPGSESGHWSHCRLTAWGYRRGVHSPCG